MLFARFVVKILEFSLPLRLCVSQFLELTSLAALRWMGFAHDDGIGLRPRHKALTSENDIIIV